MSIGKELEMQKAELLQSSPSTHTFNFNVTVKFSNGCLLNNIRYNEGWGKTAVAGRRECTKNSKHVLRKSIILLCRKMSPCAGKCYLKRWYIHK